MCFWINEKEEENKRKKILIKCLNAEIKVFKGREKEPNRFKFKQNEHSYGFSHGK